MSTPPQLYHWRGYGGNECDLILERDGKFYPIEIKAKTRPTRKDIKGISSFRNTYSKSLKTIQKGLVISAAEEFYSLSEKDLVIPWDIE